MNNPKSNVNHFVSNRTITIGSAQKDKELVAAILRYQEENKFTSSADAVRDLCRYALQVKNVK